MRTRCPRNSRVSVIRISSQLRARPVGAQECVNLETRVAHSLYTRLIISVPVLCTSARYTDFHASTSDATGCDSILMQDQTRCKARLGKEVPAQRSQSGTSPEIAKAVSEGTILEPGPCQEKGGQRRGNFWRHRVGPRTAHSAMKPRSRENLRKRVERVTRLYYTTSSLVY